MISSAKILKEFHQPITTSLYLLGKTLHDKSISQLFGSCNMNPCSPTYFNEKRAKGKAKDNMGINIRKGIVSKDVTKYDFRYA